MSYEGTYLNLIAKRNSFISDSYHIISNLNSEIRNLEAEIKLYEACYNENGQSRYLDLKFATQGALNTKQDMLDSIEKQVEDAQKEIKILDELIISEQNKGI